MATKESFTSTTTYLTTPLGGIGQFCIVIVDGNTSKITETVVPLDVYHRYASGGS